MNKDSHEYVHKHWTFDHLNNNWNIWKEFIILRPVLVVGTLITGEFFYDANNIF